VNNARCLLNPHDVDSDGRKEYVVLSENKVSEARAKAKAKAKCLK
jgi:hypothetical protein